MLNKKLIATTIILILITIGLVGCISSSKDPIIIYDYLDDVRVVKNETNRQRVWLDFANDRSKYVYTYRDDLQYFIGFNVTVVINYMTIDNRRVDYVQYIWNRDLYEE